MLRSLTDLVIDIGQARWPFFSFFCFQDGDNNTGLLQ